MSTLVLILALAALAVAVLSIAATASIVRWVIRAHARKEEILYAKIADLLDRNMHLTDGGAFGGARQAQRGTVEDDEPLTLRSLGIVEDPYDAPDNGHATFDSLHAQPTLDEVL